MSLVLEALRRVEKPGARAGGVGVAVASYRPVRKRIGAGLPLLMGLATGGALVFLFGLGSQATNPAIRGGDRGRGAAPDEVPGEPPVAVRKVLPPMKLVEAKGQARLAPPSSALAVPDSKTQATLVLQAISERDSHPVAIINDQLVREGELIGRARVLRIHADSVDVLLENGTQEAVRFAPPPPQPSPTPDSH
jgi:hypothetical protein